MSTKTKPPGKRKCNTAFKVLTEFLDWYGKPVKDPDTGEQIMSRYDMIGDAKVYSHEEWKDRRETVGDTSYATMVMDGSPLYDIFNGYERDYRKAMEKLKEMLEKHDMYYEIGYAWTLHVYA
jgi:hypothetical protein